MKMCHLMIVTIASIITILYVLPFATLGLDAPILPQTNAMDKNVVRTCLEMDGSNNSRDYNYLVESLRNAAKDKHSNLVLTIVPMPTASETLRYCDYTLRVGKVETADWTDAGYRDNPAPRAQTDVEFWLLHPGNRRTVLHDRAIVIWNESTQGLRSESKLMTTVAQKVLRAIEKEKQSPKPHP